MIKNNNIRETDLTIDGIFNSLRALLEVNRPVSFSMVPEVLHDDLFAFMVGRTMNLDAKGNPLIHKIDFIHWITKLKEQGFDYEIKLKLSV